MNWKLLAADSETISVGSTMTSTLPGVYRLIRQNAINVAKESFALKKRPVPPYSITAETLMNEIRRFDLDYRNRKKRNKSIVIMNKELTTSFDTPTNVTFPDPGTSVTIDSNLHTDFLRWEREKMMVLNNIQNRHKRTSVITSSTSFDFKTNDIPRESTAFNDYHEMILRWLDTCYIAKDPIPETITNAFKNIYANEIVHDDLNDIVDMILACGKAVATKTGFIGCLSVILRYLETLNRQVLEMPESYSDFDQLSRIIAIANEKYKRDSLKINDEYFFYILYLLLKTGNITGLEYLSSNKSESLWKDYELDPPPLYSKFCMSLVNVIKYTIDPVKNAASIHDRQLLTLDINRSSISRNPDMDNYPFYKLLIYNILLPEIARDKDHPFTKLNSLDDINLIFEKIWYRLHLILMGSPTTMPQSVANLCKEITTVGLSYMSKLSKDSTIKQVTSKLLLYCKLQCCGGCFFETLRLMMCTCQIPTVQQVAIMLTSYLDKCGVFSDGQMNYVSIQLWELPEHVSGIPYLLKVAYSSRRKVLVDTKICFAAITMNCKTNVLYAIAENYQEVMNSDMLGTIVPPTTPIYDSQSGNPNMLPGVKIGPLLNKLSKLTQVEHVSKIAIDTIAKYAIAQNKYAEAYNCYYSINSIDGMLKVIDSLLKQIVFENIDPKLGKEEIKEHNQYPSIICSMYDAIRVSIMRF